ncbi:MAG TPA: YceI family protein [Rhodanobacter sp.]
MKRLVLLLAAVLPFTAAATNYTVQPAQSQLGFSGTFQGASFDGHFTRWTAAISYDPAQPASSKFDVTVTPASAVSGDKDRDAAMPGSDFFNVATFPTAHFVSTGFRQSGAQVIVDGNLTLHGVTKPVSLDVTFKPQSGGASLDVSGTVKRLDFGIGTGDYADTSVIGADVKIKAHLQLAPK